MHYWIIGLFENRAAGKASTIDPQKNSFPPGQRTSTCGRKIDKVQKFKKDQRTEAALVSYISLKGDIHIIEYSQYKGWKDFRVWSKIHKYRTYVDTLRHYSSSPVSTDMYIQVRRYV